MKGSPYRFFYGVGLHAARLCRRAGRRLHRVLTPLRRVLTYLWKRRVVLPAHRLWRKLRALFGQFRPAFRLLAREGKQSPWRFFAALFRLFGSALRHYWDELSALGRLVGPATAALLLVFTIGGWVNADYCLNLTYHDTELGVVESSAVYDVGAQLARDRVINEDDSFSVDAVPVFNIALQRRQQPMDEDAVCDAILSTAGDSIVEATGLYVDGAFVGAMSSRDEMDEVLDHLQESYGAGENTKTQRVEFVQELEKTDGLYPISTVKGSGAMRDLLTAQSVVKRTYTVQPGDTLSAVALMHDLTVSDLRQMNPQYTNSDLLAVGEELTVQNPETLLQVKVVKTVTYTETVDYKTKTVYRDDKDTDYTRITTYGREGQQKVVAEDTYIDGVKISRKVIKKTVTRQPVTKVVEQGTRKIAPGNFRWPVPICHNYSRGYGRGHYALDICNGPVPVYGHDIVAADSGTVIYAGYGWNGGFGNMVKISHGNGLVTLYAHMSSVKVSTGQTVSRGQVIGAVGNSGASSGPHLHFEVIKNGVRVNPLNYVRP
ncbi:MAG: M23 family metallopeptidase [Clostridia bacterium]|nr:M23 family metallopeptidase [Clostridia bacterium]